MDKKLNKRNKDSEIDMAAEQFARLFWKQWHYIQEQKKNKKKSKKNDKSFSIDLFLTTGPLQVIKADEPWRLWNKVRT